MEKLPNIVIAVLCVFVIVDRMIKGNRSMSDNALWWIVIIFCLLDALFFYLGAL